MAFSHPTATARDCVCGGDVGAWPQVEAVWNKLHGERTRYDEEVRAAADFVHHASTLMVTHLRTHLIEVGEAAAAARGGRGGGGEGAAAAAASLHMHDDGAPAVYA